MLEAQRSGRLVEERVPPCRSSACFSGKDEGLNNLSTQHEQRRRGEEEVGGAREKKSGPESTGFSLSLAVDPASRWGQKKKGIKAEISAVFDDSLRSRIKPPR